MTIQYKNTTFLDLARAHSEGQPWSKADEIAFIDASADILGQFSYFGPWLTENRLSLVSDIKNDVAPTLVSPAQMRREAQALVDDAQARAHELVAQAEQTAAGIRDRANSYRDTVKSETRQMLQRSLDALDRSRWS